MKKVSKKPDLEHREVCERLERLTGGCVTFQYYPEDYWTDDPDSKGHLYSGWLSAHLNNDILDLDDRQDLKEQIVKQLEAIGDFYLDLARVVEDHLGLDTDLRVRKGRKSVTVA